MFIRKADADRFVLETETDKQRGNWIDPGKAQQPVAEWARGFYSCAAAGHRVCGSPTGET
jgi:hypothetical protein